MWCGPPGLRVVSHADLSAGCRQRAGPAAGSARVDPSLSVFFPLNSPNIESIVLNKAGRIRRAKLYYQRSRSGKSARIKEKRQLIETSTAE